METAFRGRLLRFLRTHLHDTRIDFAEPLRPLTGGVFSQVFQFSLSGTSGPWSKPLVLRLYPAEATSMQTRLEQVFQDGLAGTGFPTPRVLLGQPNPDALGQMFMIVQRLPGRSFLRGIRPVDFVRDFPRLLVAWPRTAARLLAQLHARDASVVLESAATLNISESALSTGRHLRDIEHRLSEFGELGLNDGLAWLRANEPALPSMLSIVHGDLWPGNVLMRRDHVTGVVDWDRAAVGDPALDVGFAKAGLALMPAPFPPPPPFDRGVNTAGRHIANRLHRAYEELHPIAEGRVRYFEALRSFLELSIVAQFRARPSRGLELHGPQPPWDHGVAALTLHFAQLTGVDLRLPDIDR